MNKNYIAGRRLEYKVKKALEKEGWTVTRSAGSHGIADLLAYRNELDYGSYRERLITKLVLIQCKRGKTRATEFFLFKTHKVGFNVKKIWVCQEKGKPIRWIEC